MDFEPVFKAVKYILYGLIVVVVVETTLLAVVAEKYFGWF